MEGIRSPVSIASYINIEATIVVIPHEIQHIGEKEYTGTERGRWVVLQEGHYIIDGYHTYEK
jgi:hypothetical protein